VTDTATTTSASTLADTPDEHYTIITADSHAGGSHAQYREYLDPKFRDDFDAWRGKYKNPFKDLKDDRRERNWDTARRWNEQQADGVVAEVIFPNTVPPFFPSFVLFAQPPKPDEYQHRLAGIRAHNRWMADFVAEFPERRAGIGQIFTNDIDDAIADVQWIKDHDLRGGILLPNIAPDVTWVKPLYDPSYDRLWAAIEESGLPINVHGGTGVPDYGKYPVSQLLYINEVSFYSQRPLVQFILSGIFERFPKLKFVITETGGAWVPPLLDRLDQVMSKIRDTGATGEIRYSKDVVLPKIASEYFAQNCWVGVSQPGPADAAARDAIGPDRFMWGSDYPHDEGTYPYTREHLRQVFPGLSPDQMRKVLGGNAAELYHFDLAKLAALGNQFGPTVGELATPLDKLPDNPNEALLKGSVGALI
jgi:predicted TIM-barrel fold metal-dependent hydrolase